MLLGVLSRRLDATAVDLLGSIPEPTGALAFVHDGDGLVGWGEHARLQVSGPDAAARIGEWFAAEVDGLAVTDQVGIPGSGPVCFVSLGFSADDPGVAVIPRVVLGRRDGEAFLTTIGDAAPITAPKPVSAPGQVSYADSGLSASGFIAAVARPWSGSGPARRRRWCWPTTCK